MLLVLLVLVVVLAAVSLALARALLAARRQLSDSRAAAAQRRVIALDILDPVGLARSRSIAAAPLARMAPGVLRSIVLSQTCRQMRSELAAQGVDADVRLRWVDAAGERDDDGEPEGPS